MNIIRFVAIKTAILVIAAYIAHKLINRKAPSQ